VEKKANVGLIIGAEKL